MSEKDAIEFAQLIEDLKPGEFYNEDRTWIITTDLVKLNI